MGKLFDAAGRIITRGRGLFGRAPRVWIPEQRIAVTGEVGAVLISPSGAKKQMLTRNIVTNAGDQYYAERAVADLNAGTPVPANFTNASGTFDGIMELYSGASSAPAKGNDRSNLTTLVTGSAQAMDSGYPQTSDPDSDNPGTVGADVVTYRVSYATGDANGTGIADVILTNPTPGASEAILMHAEFGATFDKTSSDTLKVFINHTFNGT